MIFFLDNFLSTLLAKVMLFLLQKPISWKNYRKQVSLVHFELKTIQIFITAYGTKLNHNVVTYEMKYFSVTLSRFNFMFLVQFFLLRKVDPAKTENTSRFQSTYTYTWLA